MKRFSIYSFVFLLILLLLVACGTTPAEPSVTTAAPTTVAPTTAEVTTASPITTEATTALPTTAAPTTATPTTAEPTTATPTTAEPPITTVPPRADLTIPYEALAAYTVVVPEGEDATTVVEAIQAKTGLTLETDDTIGSDSRCQIVIISPEEVGFDAFRYHNYRILYNESTIYLLAGSAAAREGALTALLAMMDGSRLCVPGEGYDYFHPYDVEEITINGEDLSEYEILTDTATHAYAVELRDAIIEMSGIVLPLVETPTAKCIAFSLSDNMTGLVTKVSWDTNGITLSAAEKNGAYYATRTFLSELRASIESRRIDMTINEDLTLANTAFAAPSAGAFYNESGELDRNGDGTIHIVFIGGSLTQDNQVWCPPVVEYFKAKFPNKTVTYTNAAIGATDSTMGAVRFAHDVLDVMTPDLVFVEYAVNDSGFNTENDYALKKNGVYIESIIQQCLSHEHRPAVVLLNFPRGFEPGTTAYTQWKNGVALKERIAQNYGVATVNVLDYVEALYATAKETTPSLTYADFLSNYYNSSDMVHPKATGYAVFRDAILAALDADFESFLTNRQDADLYLSDYRREILTKWELVALDADDVTIDGDAVCYTEGGAYPDNDHRYMPANSFQYPRFVDGVWQFEDGEDFAITLDVRADVVGIYGLYSPGGMSVQLYNETTETLLGSLDTGENHNRPYLTFFTQATPRRFASYTLSPTPQNTDDDTVFRIGYLIVGTYPN